jgi:hypothetical protein
MTAKARPLRGVPAAILILVPLTLIQCKDDHEGLTAPQTSGSLSVSIGASPTSGRTPLDVAFTSSVSGGTVRYIYSWSIGDGTSSSEANPRVTATSGAASATCTDEIHVFGALTPQCKATRQGTFSVKFNVVPNYCFHGGCTYFWDFGDGHSVGGIERPLHVYGAAGGYTATATVKSGGATGTCSINVNVG